MPAEASVTPCPKARPRAAPRKMEGAYRPPTSPELLQMDVRMTFATMICGDIKPVRTGITSPG